MYQPWHKRCSLPPYCPYLATSNISPNNKVNANYNGQCCEKELFTTTGGQPWHFNQAVHPTTSSNEWRQERLGSRESPNPWVFAQIVIQNEACGRETMTNPHLNQWRERKMDWRLCWERDRSGKKESWRRRGSDSARAGWYKESWQHRIGKQRTQQAFLMRWWLLLDTVWVILQVPTIGRMGKMRMMERQSRASRAKMTNQAGWWAQSSKRCSSVWRGFVRSRWCLPNWHIQDWRTQPNTSDQVIRITAHPHCGFRQPFNQKQMRMQQHLHQQRFESLWSVLRMAPEYCKCRKGLLELEVVILDRVQGSYSRTRVYPV